jgi:hypothetical protein
MTFRATLSCDAPDCPSVLSGSGHPDGLRRRAADQRGWVSVRRGREFRDYCADHRDDPLVARRKDQRETEQAILDAVFGGEG